MIALSSTEAEYIALSKAGQEACWLWNLYEEIGYIQESPNIIKGDNDGANSMACNPQFHKQSKHIATQWHWVCDLVQNGTISIESCRDPGQTANVLTKPLAHPKHQKHVKEMGLIRMWRGVLRCIVLRHVLNNILYYISRTRMKIWDICSCPLTTILSVLWLVYFTKSYYHLVCVILLQF